MKESQVERTIWQMILCRRDLDRDMDIRAVKVKANTKVSVLGIAQALKRQVANVLLSLLQMRLIIPHSLVCRFSSLRAFAIVSTLSELSKEDTCFITAPQSSQPLFLYSVPPSPSYLCRQTIPRAAAPGISHSSAYSHR